MNLLKILFPSLLTSALLAGAISQVLAEESPLDFKEVFELLKSQLKDAQTVEIEDAAARALIKSLAPRVRLGNAPDTIHSPDWPTNAVRSEVFDSNYGYLHISEFATGLATVAVPALRGLVENHPLKGLILDLRFCHGTDYSAAVQLADLFFESEVDLINYGEGMKSSSSKTNAIQLPLVVLVNPQTGGAAEALAAILRQGGIALIMGGTTAGEATIYREFKLASGPSLWIASEPVKIGNDQLMPLSGVEPDISLTVLESNERQWLEDHYADLLGSKSDTQNESSASPASTPSKRHLNEAELVRMMREGDPGELDPSFTPKPNLEPKTPPLIQDPALARALDFLKGLALVRKFKAQ